MASPGEPVGLPVDLWAEAFSSPAAVPLDDVLGALPPPPGPSMANMDLGVDLPAVPGAPAPPQQSLSLLIERLVCSALEGHEAADVPAGAPPGVDGDLLALLDEGDGALKSRCLVPCRILEMGTVAEKGRSRGVYRVTHIKLSLAY